MSNYKWLLDAGHGGINSNGKYTTAPSNMFTFKDGLVFYEGHYNRQIVDRLAAKLKAADIRFAFIHDKVSDTSSRERARRANRFYAQDKSCIYLSVQSDVMPLTPSCKGSGTSIYALKGHTSSIRIADIFISVYKKAIAKLKFPKNRSGGDDDKEEDFYVLARTNCPIVLVENSLFNNRHEAAFLMSERGQEIMSSILFQCIKETEKRKPI